MAMLLSDSEISKLVGAVILNGDAACLRPNSYVLRLGSEGEFINTGKDFKLGERGKKGIVVQPGHSVGVTAYETIDFRRETVQKLFPGCDLHGIISPTTDLSREGIVAPTTQVDAGYHGTLNWTLTNTSSEQRRFVFKERLFRLSIFKLGPGETPENLYSGDYQSQLGYVRSQRQGAPVGMKESDWVDAQVKGGPEDLLENLIKSGYPWHLLGQRLKVINQQFQSVTDEYAQVHEALSKLSGEVMDLRQRQGDLSDTIRRVVRDETGALQNRWLIGAGSVLVGFVGLTISATSNAVVLAVLKEHGVIVGAALTTAAVVALFLISKRNH